MGWPGDVRASGGRRPALHARFRLVKTTWSLFYPVVPSARRTVTALAYSLLKCGNSLWIYYLGQDAALMMAREG